MQGQFNPAAAAAPTTGSTTRWSREIDDASRQTGVPVALLHAVMRQESNGDPSSLSPVGAIGLMQLMPDTARGLGVNPHDANQNILGGAKYLRQMYNKFGNWHDAVAAYNAGPDDSEASHGKRIGPFAKSHDDPRYRVWENPSNGGYAETRNYVKRITDDVNSRGRN